MQKSPVFIWQKRVLKKIYPDEIHCLVVDRNYTNIFFAPKKYWMVRCTLDSALKMLPADEFVKTHRSYAVSINFIEEISRDCVRISGEDIPLARRYYKPLLERLTILGGRTPPEKDE